MLNENPTDASYNGVAHFKNILAKYVPSQASNKIEIKQIRKAIKEMYRIEMNEEMNEEVDGIIKREIKIEKIKRKDGNEIEMADIDKINSRFINKCREYIEERQIFQNIEIGSDMSKLFPLNDSWGVDDVEEIFKIAQNSKTEREWGEELPRQKQRGKSAPIREDSMADRPFVCSFKECSRGFKRLEHLKRHLKMHTGEKPFKCSYPGCNRMFSRSDNLHSHYKIHNIPQKKAFYRIDPYEADFDTFRQIK